jgi:hypothetical protein
MAVGKNELTYELLNQEINYFTVHFLSVIYKHLNLAIYFKNYVNIDIKTDFYDYISKYFQENAGLFKSNASLMILSKFHSLFKGNITKNNLEELRELLAANRHSFKELDYQYLYTDLLNFCIKQYSANSLSYKVILTLVLKDCIDNEVYIRSGNIHELNYTTVISLALSLNEPAMADMFLNKYKESLLPANRENVYAYNYAHICFSLDEFEKALEMLSTVKLHDYYFKIGIYDLRLKIFYELSSLEAALSLIDSYKHYLSRESIIPPDFRKSHDKFLKYYTEVFKIKAGLSEASADFVNEKLKKESEVSSKSWLAEKLSELSNVFV